MITLTNKLEVFRQKLDRTDNPYDGTLEIVVTASIGAHLPPLPGAYDDKVTATVTPYVSDVTIHVHDEVGEQSGHITLDRSMLGDLVDIASKLDAALPADIDGNPARGDRERDVDEVPLPPAGEEYDATGSGDSGYRAGAEEG